MVSFFFDERTTQAQPVGLMPVETVARPLSDGAVRRLFAEDFEGPQQPYPFFGKSMPDDCDVGDSQAEIDWTWENWTPQGLPPRPSSQFRDAYPEPSPEASIPATQPDDTLHTPEQKASSAVASIL